MSVQRRAVLYRVLLAGRSQTQTERWCLVLSYRHTGCADGCGAPMQLQSLSPDTQAADTGEAGTLWSFNFFLYNRKAKRMLYFSCRGVSKSVGSSESRYYSSPTPSACNLILPNPRPP